MSKIILIEEDDITFKPQIYRQDILTNILLNILLPINELYTLLMTDNNTINDESRQGWLYESLWQLMIITKCINGISYNKIYEGQLQSLRTISNINTLLECKVGGGGNNIVDIVIEYNNILMPFSIKYKNKYGETDISKIYSTINEFNVRSKELFKLGLIVKKKN